VTSGPRRAASPDWWRSAVLYQVYIRSFADGNGDGVGDVAGIRSRLGYLAELGVDALWITPWYPSPMADGGYDVADYRGIAPEFGTLAEAEQLIAEAHQHGLRVLLDLVPNHTSHDHAWFRAAVAADPGSPERARYWFRDGRGPDGSRPPNDWVSVFGGPAWTRTTDADGRPGQWYLHLFAPEQPDLRWDDPGVRAEFESILRFWFDRGVDGFRIDVAHGLAKDPRLPDLGDDVEELLATPDADDHPHWDRDGVHEIYRDWRRVADSYADTDEGRRVFVAEAWVRTNTSRLARYLRSDELHTAFNFDLLKCPWDADRVRAVVDRNLASLADVAAPATWVLSNHDVVRHVTRYGRALGDEDAFAGAVPTDLARGRRRSRAATLLMLALPGSAYVYQGEELGLPEVEDLPLEALQDPIWVRSGHKRRGRDGCRVPLPWSPDGPALGFGEGAPWLPQPAAWRDLAVSAQRDDPASMLTLYRSALARRRELPELHAEGLSWVDSAPGTLAWRRGPRFACVVNFGPDPVPLPCGGELLMGSGPLGTDGAAAAERLRLKAGGPLPGETAVWLRTEG